MTFLSVLLLATSAAVSVAGKGFSLDTYSAIVSSTYSTVKSTGVVSMVPDPNTDDLQPIVALNVTTSPTTSMILVGGVRSYVGGVAQLPYSYTPGDRRLDLFDFSRGGWPSLPSTMVTKAGSITTYSSNCSIATGCSYLYGSYVQLSTYPGSTISLSVNSRRNVPLTMNVTVGTGSTPYVWTFEQFDTDASTYQLDDSIYTLGAYYYPVIAPTPPPTPNVTKISFYRSFTNDTFSRNLANDNAASPAGEANWICPSPRQGLIIAQFDVTVDANWGTYAMCNKGSCMCGQLSSCQRVGKQMNGIATNLWYSFPQSAMCAKGYPIGTNNCTWQADYKLVAAITSDCFSTVKGDPNYPNGYTPSCTNLDTVGAHIVFAMQNCPDIKDSLPWPESW